MMVLAPPMVFHGMGQASYVQRAAANYPGVPNLAAVATAVMNHESGGNPGAKNPNSSACGLFQLINATQSTLGVSDCTDPTQNADAGVGLLAQYYNQYGNWDEALQAFSDGPGTVAAGQNPSSQTEGLINYVESNAGISLPGGLDLSDLSFPDLSSFSISDSVGLDLPDWVTWLGIGVLGAGLVLTLSRA